MPSARPSYAAGPLAGVRVLDLGIWRPAPFATQLLADLGAAVTKVEPPGGDPMRMFPTLYRSLNHRKDVVELDLKDADGRAAVLELASQMDVAIEGFRPGVADRLGVGVGALRAANPAIVCCSISGFGQDGPLRDAPGHDLNYQAWTGFLAARAPEIHTSGVPVGDLAGGAYAALAICATLVGRRRAGGDDTAARPDAGTVGAAIDVSMADVLLSWAGPEIGGALASSDDPGSGFPAYGTFACADGHVTLGVVSEDPFWVALCTTLGLGDVASLDVEARARDASTLRTRLDDAIAPRTRDELVRELVAAGVPVAPVLGAREAMRDSAFAHRPVVRDGIDVQPGLPLRFT
jgi:crotonobetainyl-CoA:carnitine CoA-transferase CaiB-like acyl-CoA transferase